MPSFKAPGSGRITVIKRRNPAQPTKNRGQPPKNPTLIPTAQHEPDSKYLSPSERRAIVVKRRDPNRAPSQDSSHDFPPREPVIGTAQERFRGDKERILHPEKPRVMQRIGRGIKRHPIVAAAALAAGLSYGAKKGIDSYRSAPKPPSAIVEQLPESARDGNGFFDRVRSILPEGHLKKIGGERMRPVWNEINRLFGVNERRATRHLSDKSRAAKISPLQLCESLVSGRKVLDTPYPTLMHSKLSTERISRDLAKYVSATEAVLADAEAKKREFTEKEIDQMSILAGWIKIRSEPGVNVPALLKRAGILAGNGSPEALAELDNIIIALARANREYEFPGRNIRGQGDVRYAAMDARKEIFDVPVEKPMEFPEPAEPLAGPADAATPEPAPAVVRKTKNEIRAEQIAKIRLYLELGRAEIRWQEFLRGQTAIDAATSGVLRNIGARDMHNEVFYRLREIANQNPGIRTELWKIRQTNQQLWNLQFENPAPAQNVSRSYSTHAPRQLASHNSRFRNQVFLSRNFQNPKGNPNMPRSRRG